MMVVKKWKLEDSDKVLASLYRKIMRIYNKVHNIVILNTIKKIQLATEVI